MTKTLPEIKAFLTCDRAVHQAGKTSCEGIFNTVFALVYPVVHANIYLYIAYMGGKGVFDQKVSFLTENGKVLYESPLEQVRLPTHEFVAHLEHLELPSPGRYWLSLTLDGQEVKRIWLRAQKTPLRSPFTDDEIKELLANPQSIKKVRAQAECKKCERKHLFQMNLDPKAPLDDGHRPFPESKSFVCECGTTHDLKHVWASAWQMLGSVQPKVKPEESQQAE